VHGQAKKMLRLEGKEKTRGADGAPKQVTADIEWAGLRAKKKVKESFTRHRAWGGGDRHARRDVKLPAPDN